MQAREPHYLENTLREAIDNNHFEYAKGLIKLIKKKMACLLGQA